MTKERRSYAVTLVCATCSVFGAAFGVTNSQAQSVPAVSDMEAIHGAHVMRVHGAGRPNSGGLLAYRGGLNGTGVQTAPDAVYLIYWGSQWNNDDPSGQAVIQQSFFNGVGGSSWNSSVTQYCEGVPVGTTDCGSSGTDAANLGGVLAGVWFDNGTAAPRHPTQSQIAAEAVRAATHFGGVAANAQYVINTATGNNSRGFGTQYCAYHSSTGSTLGEVAYTYMPYITDAGASCGANFNGLGPKAGITIVGGHEFAETETDPYPNTGWLDSSGAENGDKCAWIASGQGAATTVTLTTGHFPVQSLWSNAFNSGFGGCVLSYP
jgi:serine protease